MIVDISNSPLIGVKRKAELLKMIWDCQSQSLSIELLITYYDDNGNIIKGEGVNEYKKILVANNSSKVNLNGDIISPNNEEYESAIGEYDFYMYLVENGPVNITQLIELAIQKADQSPFKRLE